MRDAAVNAGFFVLDPAAGAPGDPAGVAAYDGRLVSEPIAGRPALLLRDDARGTSIVRLRWRGEVAGLTLDGLNRVPGLIRNCGGLGDTPTDRPRHDFTCTDPDELIAFDPAYGARTPSGPGAEVVLDRSGRVTEIRPARGGTIPAGGRTVQATGAKVDALLAVARPGRKLPIRATLIDERGRPVRTSPDHVDRQRRSRTGPRRPAARHAGRRRDGASRAIRASTTAGCTSGTRAPSPGWMPRAVPC